MPIRIQRKRTKGFRLPPNAVYVGRPTKWGNPFRVGGSFRFTMIRDQEMAVEWFRSLMKTDPIAMSELRGKDLACWCRLCEKHKDGKPLGVECPDCAPCHADILLEIANG